MVVELFMEDLDRERVEILEDRAGSDEGVD